MSIGPSYAPDAGDWLCDRCQSPLEQKKMLVYYLKNSFEVYLPCCPQCKLTLIPKSLAEGKMLEVEKLLEDK